MKRHLRIYVKEVLFRGEQLPQDTNRRYFPKTSDLRTHMYRATIKYRLSRIDQANVQLKVDEWTKRYNEDSFFFRPHKDQDHDNVPETECHENDSENVNHVVTEEELLHDEVLLTNERGEQKKKLLFVHQTAWQKRLLGRYGNNICLLDATYKTTRYALPLFFLAVKTNVDYQVVGSFVTEDETVVSINEALEVLRNWNPEWSPPFFMTDNSLQEIQAIEKLFPGKCKSSFGFTNVKVYLERK